MRVLFVTQQIDYEPQGIMHLSSALKAAGHQVELAVAAHPDPLAVARAFVSGRKVMLLDEPSMGLAPLLMLDMFKALEEINREGTTILLVEQNARIALKFAQRGYVLESGNLVLEGPSEDLLNNPDVKKAYLGG